MTSDNKNKIRKVTPDLLMENSLLPCQQLNF